MSESRVTVIGGPEIRSYLKTLADRLDDQGRRDMLVAAAEGVSGALKAHFERKNQTPNKLGGARTEFWGQLSAATGLALTVSGKGGAAEIIVNDRRLNIHVYGGTLTPTTTKYLAIPVHPDAHGKRAREITNLVAVMTGAKKTLVLARKTSGSTLETMYVLKRSVTISKDPDALPPVEALSAAGTEAAADYLAALVDNLA